VKARSPPNLDRKRASGW